MSYFTGRRERKRSGGWKPRWSSDRGFRGFPRGRGRSSFSQRGYDDRDYHEGPSAAHILESIEEIAQSQDSSLTLDNILSAFLATGVNDERSRYSSHSRASFESRRRFHSDRDDYRGGGHYSGKRWEGPSYRSQSHHVKSRLDADDLRKRLNKKRTYDERTSEERKKAKTDDESSEGDSAEEQHESEERADKAEGRKSGEADEDSSKKNQDKTDQDQQEQAFPVQALYCHICDLHKFNSKIVFRDHLNGASHKKMFSIHKIKSFHIFRILQCNAAIAASKLMSQAQKIEGSLSMESRVKCVKCSCFFPKIYQSHHYQSIEHQLVASFKGDQRCCQKVFEGRLDLDEHRLTIKHLLNEYEEKQKQEKQEGVQEEPTAKVDSREETLESLKKEAKPYDSNIEYAQDILEARKYYYCSPCHETVKESQKQAHCHSFKHYEHVIKYIKKDEDEEPIADIDEEKEQGDDEEPDIMDISNMQTVDEVGEDFVESKSPSNEGEEEKEEEKEEEIEDEKMEVKEDDDDEEPECQEEEQQDVDDEQTDEACDAAVKVSASAEEKSDELTEITDVEEQSQTEVTSDDEADKDGRDGDTSKEEVSKTEFGMDADGSELETDIDLSKPESEGGKGTSAKRARKDSPLKETGEKRTRKASENDVAKEEPEDDNVEEAESGPEATSQDNKETCSSETPKKKPVPTRRMRSTPARSSARSQKQ